MPTEDQTVRVVFEAVDRYTGVANRIQQNMQSVSGSAQQLVVSSQSLGQVTGWEDLEGKLLAATSGAQNLTVTSGQAAAAQGAVGKAATDAGRQVQAAMDGKAVPATKSLGSSFSALLSPIGKVTGAVALLGVTFGKALDIAESGTRIINLSRAFEDFARTAGTSGDAVLAAMMDASNGMLSQAQAMQEYNRTYLLAGEEIANQMPKMIQVALAATASGMGDFDYMLNSLVTGLGRLSTPILDNLGLTLSLEKAYADYAGTIGVAVDELSKGQQQIAVWTQIQEQMTAKMGDLDKATAAMAGQGVPRLRAAWTDFIDYLEVKAAPTIDAMADGLADALSGLPLTELEAIELTLDKIAVSQETLQVPFLSTAELERYEAQLWAQIGALDLASLSTEEYGRLLEMVGNYSGEAAAKVAELRNVQDIARRQAAFLTEVNQELAQSEDEVASAAEREARALQILSGGLAAAQEAAWARWRANEGLRYQIVGGVDPLTGETWYPFQQPKGGPDLITTAEQIEHVWDTHETGISNAVSGYDTLKSSMESYYESWASQAESILTPTQTVDMEALMEEVYGYQEKWDEAARRAMDVVKLGAESPWAQPMGLESKEEALQYIRDFYAGKLPEAVNWEAAISQYQLQMEGMIGEQNLATLFQEKLIGAGWGPENEAVMMALGAPFEPGGEAAAASFANAFVDYDWESMAASSSALILTGLVDHLNKGQTQYSDQFERFIISVVKRVFFAGAEP